jgi:hypothetical protein
MRTSGIFSLWSLSSTHLGFFPCLRPPSGFMSQARRQVWPFSSLYWGVQTPQILQTVWTTFPC